MSANTVHVVSADEIDAALSRLEAIDRDAANMLRAQRALLAALPHGEEAGALLDDLVCAATILNDHLQKFRHAERPIVAELVCRLRGYAIGLWDV